LNEPEEIEPVWSDRIVVWHMHAERSCLLIWIVLSPLSEPGPVCPVLSRGISRSVCLLQAEIFLDMLIVSWNRISAPVWDEERKHVEVRMAILSFR